MKPKISGSKNAYLGPLLNVHIKFQLLGPIWWGDNGGTALFQRVKKEKNLYIPPTNCLKMLIFGYVMQLKVLYRLVLIKTIFLSLTLQHPLAQIWTY